jgi:hypothetical protein
VGDYSPLAARRLQIFRRSVLWLVYGLSGHCACSELEVFQQGCIEPIIRQGAFKVSRETPFHHMALAELPVLIHPLMIPNAACFLFVITWRNVRRAEAFKGCLKQLRDLIGVPLLDVAPMQHEYRLSVAE